MLDHVRLADYASPAGSAYVGDCDACLVGSTSRSGRCALIGFRSLAC
jgi:hypothetical protein